MYTHQPTMEQLFAQLGLASDPAMIERFIMTHRLSDCHQPLDQAAFWTTNQATFLHDEKENDAEWAILIDTLDSELRNCHSADKMANKAVRTEWSS